MPRAKNPNPKSREVSGKSALAALATLVQYGRQSFKQEYQQSRGRGVCLGLALSKCDFSGTQILEASAALLEDINAHRMSEIVSKIVTGDFVVEEDKKTVTIRLDY